MKKLVLVLALGLGLASCEKEPIEEVTEEVIEEEFEIVESISDKLEYKTPIQILNEGTEYSKLIGRRYKERRIYKIDTFTNITYTYEIITRKSYYNHINFPIYNYSYLSSYIANYETVRFIDENIGLIRTAFCYKYWTSTKHLYHNQLKVYNTRDKDFNYINPGGENNMSVICTEFQN